MKFRGTGFNRLGAETAPLRESGRGKGITIVLLSTRLIPSHGQGKGIIALIVHSLDCLIEAMSI